MMRRRINVDRQPNRWEQSVGSKMLKSGNRTCAKHFLSVRGNHTGVNGVLIFFDKNGILQ